MGSWAEVLAEGLYLKGWTIGDPPEDQKYATE